MKTHEQLLVVLVLIGTALGKPALAATRHYYIAAEDVTWDFTPTNKNLIHCMDEPAPCAIPVPWTNSHIFKKTRYIEYTENFEQKKPQLEWLGILGPIIRAEEGDTVIVHFRNNSTYGSFGMHPHGLRYTKENEGGHYTGVNSGQERGVGADVPPGGTHKYVWTADAESAPGDGEVSSKVWWYHSHVYESSGTNRGLLGPIIVTKKGWAKADGSPKDVDKEFVTAFMIFDELAGEEAGLMHSINGYIFGNLKGLVMENGERVRWHVLGMGNEVDLHSAHWHGKTLTIGSPPFVKRTDVVELLPASMVTADMNADNPGEWMYHCHVFDHINAGMMTSYQILP